MWGGGRPQLRSWTALGTCLAPTCVPGNEEEQRVRMQGGNHSEGHRKGKGKQSALALCRGLPAHGFAWVSPGY